jgi:hypothetical protein
MAKKPFSQPPGGPTVKQSAILQQILCALESPDAGTRAAAVRELCPCRTAFDVPVQRYIAAMQDDPSPTVRHEVHHVLDEDSGWGRRLQQRRVKAAIEATEANDDDPGPYSIAWRRPRKPRNRGRVRPRPLRVKGVPVR